MFHTQSRMDFESMIVGAIILTTGAAWAQSPNDLNVQPPRESRPPTNQLHPEEISGQPGPTRKIHRIGTALGPAPGSVSIKSTEAGPAGRRPPKSGCNNCGIVDSINKIAQGNQLNAISSGVVAGAIAREVIRQTPQAHPYPHPSPYSGYPPHSMGGLPGYHGATHYPSQYQVGVTMPDGSQSIIVLPDVSHLQHGDRVQLIDGAIIVDRQQ